MKLAYLIIPDDSEETWDYFRELTERSIMTCTTIAPSQVVLTPRGSAISINELIVQEGLAYMGSMKNLEENDTFNRLISAQEKARQRHIGLWRYGDFTGDE